MLPVFVLKLSCGNFLSAIKEIRYSLNSEALDKTFNFKATDKMFEVGDDLYLTVPGDSQYASVQITYKDGTKSPVQKVMRAQ